ncbi:hypothetical protein GCM10025780_29880 [Frondihabitans cladoniiphilus]|uniref:Uncharacterized protein n=1 Tax=Frondihabitans cladoniiphilus TaxID=715785 RepID=A0ABP8W798_9MICO
MVRYKASDSSKTFTQASGANSAVTGQGGVTLSISRSTTFTVSGTFTSTTGVTVSAGLAAIKEDIGVSVGVSHSGTSTSSGSWTVPSNWSYGRLEIGSLKHRGTVQKYIENTQCALNASGSAAIYNVPETGWTFVHVNAS